MADTNPGGGGIGDNGAMRLLMACLFLAAAGPSLALDQYRVDFEPGLGAVNVRACFDGEPPARLYHAAEAARFVRNPPNGERATRLTEGRTSTRLRGMSRDDCLSWRVDLDAATAGGNPRLAARVNGDFVSDADLWFFRAAGDRDAEVSVLIPQDHGFSTPWEYLGENQGRKHYRPASTPATWSSRIAVGTFDIRQLEVNGGILRLAVLGKLETPVIDKLADWMQHAARGVASVYGQYPQPGAQLLVVPIGPRGEPVPWAHVMRGGGAGAEFFVDETRPLSQFKEDWTAGHELSHMLLPLISGRDRWLSEGLASYYQYVLLARSGMMTETEAWQGLHEGFERGRRDTSDEPLSAAVMKGSWPTMRIYWSGAAMMLLADAALREASGNRLSLDSALAGLGACCLSGDRRWRARELFEQLDRITGTSVFGKLYAEHVNSHSFPDLASLERSLGIVIRKGRVSLAEPAPLAHVRKSIMGNRDGNIRSAD